MSSSRSGNVSFQKESNTVNPHEDEAEPQKNGNGVIPKPLTRVDTDQTSSNTETEAEAQESNANALRDAFDDLPEKHTSKSSKPFTPPKPSKLSRSGSSGDNASFQNAHQRRQSVQGNQQPRNNGQAPLSHLRRNPSVEQSLSDTPNNITRVNTQIHSLKNVAEKIIKRNRTFSAIGITTSHDNLCSTCRSLDLTAEKFIVKDRQSTLRNMPYLRGSSKGKSQPTEVGPFEVGSGSGRCMLGNLKWIWEQQVYCSFCRLIIKSLLDQADTSWIDRDKGPNNAGIPRGKRHYLDAHCYATWQIDGRELVADSEGVPQPLARTRRIRLHWDNSDFAEVYIVLIAQPTSNNDLFLGRELKGTAANPSVIKRWIDLCDQKHGERCKFKTSIEFEEMIQQAYFGVIDVQDMCLAKLPQPGARYVALSYTWGDAEPFKTTLSNIRALQQNRGLDNVFLYLPRAIRDAINLVRDLGERYFWVDSICIVQDSVESWELNAKVMDLVYGNAYFTICAADGDNPNVGLVAMNPSERGVSQHIEEHSHGVQLMVTHLAEAYIQKSTWNKRAWTFQERLLSKRCVIFTHGRVFFQCRSGSMREDIISEEGMGWSIEHAHAPLQILDDLDTRALRIYMQCVELYTSRRLRKPQDILSAFNGIGNLLGGSLGPGQTSADLLFGLPKSHFDLALLWQPQAAPQRRIIEKESNQREVKFPSWSWCGWKDAVIGYKASMIDGTMTNVHEWLMDHTWITWYIRDGKGNLKLVWNNSNKAPPEITRWTGYQREQTDDTAVSDSYGRSLEKKWPEKKRTSFVKTLKDYPFGVSIALPITTQQYSLLPDLHYLQFRTWSALLRLNLTGSSTSQSVAVGEGLDRFGISDYKGDWCGTIILDKSWSKKTGPGIEHEFIAISEAKEFSKEEHDNWMYYIPSQREQSEWDLYYVLLVEVHDEIAHRVGLGKVYKEAFRNSCVRDAKWKEFILG